MRPASPSERPSGLQSWRGRLGQQGLIAPSGPALLGDGPRLVLEAAGYERRPLGPRTVCSTAPAATGQQAAQHGRGEGKAWASSARELRAQRGGVGEPGRGQRHPYLPAERQDQRKADSTGHTCGLGGRPRSNKQLGRRGSRPSTEVPLNSRPRQTPNSLVFTVTCPPSRHICAWAVRKGQGTGRRGYLRWRGQPAWTRLQGRGRRARSGRCRGDGDAGPDAGWSGRLQALCSIPTGSREEAWKRSGREPEGTTWTAPRKASKAASRGAPGIELTGTAETCLLGTLPAARLLEAALEASATPSSGAARPAVTAARSSRDGDRGAAADGLGGPGGAVLRIPRR
ncbi:unnamed protein product [Rangifer tarandus platyrhynchus]|uniref:Uncharacterized protein n=1 Tax=Rangifer tarandus platyrhynchus TaxID=3082113 RepID=A0ABN8Y9W6_RANTA|nr:unnamed protein product [Rangifer tarandus platyrhynchus]